METRNIEQGEKLTKQDIFNLFYPLLNKDEESKKHFCETYGFTEEELESYM